MHIPVLKQGPFLVASVQGDVTDTDLTRLRDELLETVGRVRSRGVVIDVTTLDVLDSFSTRTLQALAGMVRMRGARTVVVGIQPDVALAMVELGLRMVGVPTALDLEEGLAYLERATRVEVDSAR